MWWVYSFGGGFLFGVYPLFLRARGLNQLQMNSVLAREGVIEGGMLPKVEACVRALKGGVGQAYIVDGRLPNALLLKLFTHTGLGTEVVL